MATIADCARHLDMSIPNLNDMLRRGVITKALRGAYDMDAVRVEYIRHVRKLAAGRGGSAGNSQDEATLVKERIRVTQLKADALEIDQQERVRALVPAADAAREVGDMLARVRTRLLALGSDCATQLAPRAGKPAAEVKSIIDERVRKALLELSRGGSS